MQIFSKINLSNMYANYKVLIKQTLICNIITQIIISN